jgi:hypothetical protein
MLVSGLALAAPASASANTFTIIETFEINDTFNVPCAGESVEVSGTIREVLHITEDANGGFHLHFTATPLDISGVGLLSGDIYRGTGATNFTRYIAPGYTEVVSAVDNTLLIGPGPGNNLYMRSRFQFTRNANNEIVVLRDVVSVACQ